MSQELIMSLARLESTYSKNKHKHKANKNPPQKALKLKYQRQDFSSCLMIFETSG